MLSRFRGTLSPSTMASSGLRGTRVPAMPAPAEGIVFRVPPARKTTSPSRRLAARAAQRNQYRAFRAASRSW
jgi:hypothetical protein